jgi:hypothetical protein
VPFAPTTARDFTPDETLMAYLELYEGGKRASATPHKLRVDAELRRVNGDVVRTATESVASSAPARASGARPFTLTMPLEGLSPGTYVLSFQGVSTVSAGDVVTRSIPIHVH